MEKISIALATYNGEKFIEKQLDSILNQTIRPDEVIIVDDNSSDDTVVLVEKFIEQNKLTNWELFSNKENLGYKRNFYNALRRTSGEIVFLSDQDDEWHENKIEIMLKTFQMNIEIKTLNSAVDLIDESSNKIIQKADKNFYNSNFLYLERIPKDIEYFDMAYLGLHNISPGCTMAVKREIIDIFLQCYNFRLPHDWFMNLIAAAYGGCAFLNTTLVDYRQHGSNAIGANTNPAVGILKKTRMIRIDDYSSRNSAIQCVTENVGVKIDERLRAVISLNGSMISFYEKPNPIKLIRLRLNPLYYQLAKKRVQIWEILVSFRLDKLIIDFVKKGK